MEIEIEFEFPHPNEINIVHDDLLILKEVCEALPLELKISRVIVPKKFDETVNKIEGTIGYTSIRGQVAMGKTIPLADETIIVLSPGIFYLDWDDQFRHLFYFHELAHAINAGMLRLSDYELFSELCLGWSPETSDRTNLEYQDIHNMHALYDEYYAHRKSLEMIDYGYPEKTNKFNELIESTASDHATTFTEIDKYIAINKEFAELQRHQDVKRYMANVVPIFEVISKSIVYYFSIIHHYQHLADKASGITDSFFINRRTMILVEFLKKAYENERINWEKGVILIRKFFLNFGMDFFEDYRGAGIKIIKI